MSSSTLATGRAAKARPAATEAKRGARSATRRAPAPRKTAATPSPADLINARDEAIRERDLLIKARDMLAERVDELTGAGDPLAIRVEYERVVAERDAAIRARDEHFSALKAASEKALRDDEARAQERTAHVRRIADIAYERDCALDDLARQKEAVIALAARNADLEARLRETLRAQPPKRLASTYADPLARTLRMGGGA